MLLSLKNKSTYLSVFQWYALLLLILPGCSVPEKGQEDEKLLQQAHHYHLQASEKSRELRGRLEELEQQLSALQSEDAKTAFSSQLDSCRQELQELGQHITEVPGFAHEHAHEHHHHHPNAPELSPPQQLALQQAYLQTVEKMLFSTDSLASALQKFTYTKNEAIQER